MPETRTDLWVFRETRQANSGENLVRQLRCCLQELCATSGDNGSCVSALIQAGELETALADASFSNTNHFTALTDALASCLCDGDLTRVKALAESLDKVPIPDALMTSPPEGFSYFALHPIDFANLAAKIVGVEPAAVIGIRSIGSTLSALVAAAFRRNGRSAERITVRPTGHPYDRVAHFTAEQTRWIQRQQEQLATFLVVDEGPGRSGSTFLSVAEALVENRVPPERITLLGSGRPEPSLLCAINAAERWRHFRFLVTEPSLFSRFSDYMAIGSGEWRHVFLPDSHWPACWPQMERIKFLSKDHTQLFKFEGLGRVGEQARERARLLAGARFSCPVEDAGDGFAGYKVSRCEYLTPDDLCTNVLDRMAEYFAFRAAEFSLPGNSTNSLGEMLSFNLRQEFQTEWDGNLEALHSARCVVTDGRMQPHEWIRTADLLLKTDAVSHGDDQFFPGPCDIAWDLAGAAVEWNMHADAVNHLISRFLSLTGDDLHQRLPDFLLAYAIFRLAHIKMALPTVVGTSEEPRLQRACLQYHQWAKRQLENSKRPALVCSG